MKLIPDTAIGKKQFLIEHNRLSPVNLQATFEMITAFQEAKKPLLKDADWSNKLRIPLITWLVALPSPPQDKKKGIREPIKSVYKNFPNSEN